MNNYTRVRKTNQAWQQKDCIPLEHIANNPVQHITALPQKHKDLINYLLEHENKNHALIYPTQTTLGRVIGCGRQRANEIVGELQNLGLISTNYRHMTSCLYKTSSFLRTPFMAQKLSHLFPSLKKLLLLLAIGSFKTEATQGILKNYNVYSNTSFFKKNGLGTVGEIQKRVHRYSPLPQCLSRQPLTLEQKCTLAAFPEWLLDQAMFKVTDMSRINNLGGYLYSYCRKHWDKPNWIWSSQLKDIYKNEQDYHQIPLHRDDEDTAVLYERSSYSHAVRSNAPRGNPQKRMHDELATPRRSHEGCSPMVVTERKPDRLLQLEELQAQIEKYNAMADQNLAKLFVQGLMNRQMNLINNLSPQELEHWNTRKGI